MVMESRDDEYSDYLNGFSLDDESILPLFVQSPGLTYEYKFKDEHLDLGFLEICNSAPKSGPCTASPDDFGDCVIKFINEILVDEDVEAKQSMFHDPLALQATERSFYEALGEKYPHQQETEIPSNVETSEENIFSSLSEISTNSGTSGSNTTYSNWSGGDSLEAKSSAVPIPSLEYPLLSSVSSTTTSVTNDGTLDSLTNAQLVENVFTDSESILLFQRGVEEASKFLPPIKPLVIDLDQYNLPSNSRDNTPLDVIVIKEEIKETCKSYRGRKHHKLEDNGNEEERSSKQSAVHVEEVVSEMFDRVALCTDPGGPSMSACEAPRKKVTKKFQKGQSYGCSSGWISRYWGGSSGELMDVRTLLVKCAQSVAANDRLAANEQLKQIRQHASPLGDAPQRLAHCFATGLEARLAGTGSQLYATKSAMTISAAEKLKAYQVFLSACPFEKIAIFFANKVLYEAALTSSTLHIVDFGIAYGFQWPVLIKHLSQRPGGPPKLRITGIEFPKPGFRPAEGVEETGRRLGDYCAKYKVPFEYNAIATQHWEAIRIEDLKLQRNECLAVNTLIRFKNLLDESVMVDNPRDRVLKLIRDMKPDVFVQTVVNATSRAPSFVSRFKEALFYFSSMLDMFDATLDRTDEQRLNFEKEFCGREAMNVIACEGAQLVERPETYKHWEERNTRAGLKIKPLSRDLVSKLRASVKSGYHRDFAFDDDGKWVLQGWKGRILWASSCWVPA